MVGFAENLEADGVYAVPVEGPVLRAHKRRRGHNGEGAGAPNTSSTSFVLAGSWLTLKDLTGKDLTLAQDAHQVEVENDEDIAWKITTDGLAKRLAEKSPKLVDVNGRLRVLDDA